MHADVSADGVITVTVDPDPADPVAAAAVQVAVTAAAAVAVALEAWRRGDEDTANQALRHAVHSGVPPMALLLEGAHESFEVVSTMPARPPVEQVASPEGGLRVIAVDGP